MDFSVISRAGLTQSEFAAAVGVSRVTVNTWVRGKMKPHRYITKKVSEALAHLSACIEAGDLPATGPDKKDKLARLHAIVLVC